MFHGEYSSEHFDESHLTDLSRREMLYFGAMILGLVWMGMYPQSFLDLSQPVLAQLLNSSQGAVSDLAGIQ